MNVKIIRVLNTNAVVSVDSQGMELIMTGPGIGLKKRKGENIDQSLADGSGTRQSPRGLVYG